MNPRLAGCIVTPFGIVLGLFLLWAVTEGMRGCYSLLREGAL